MTTLTATNQGTTSKAEETTDICHEVARLKIGEIEIEILSEVPGILDQYLALYPGCSTENFDQPPIRVSVRRKRKLPLLKQWYEVRWARNRKFVTREKATLLPYLEWAVNRQITLYRPEFVQIHASVVQGPHGGLVFPADPGSGKSTLAMTMVRNGWNYLSDEFALIDTRDEKLKPYPKAICIKEGSYGVTRELGIQLEDNGSYIKPLKGRVRFIRPDQVRENCIGTPCSLQAVIFPKYVPGEKTRLQPISRAEAAFQMNHQCFNFLDHGNPGLELITKIISKAECFRLHSGGAQQACTLLDQVFGSRHDQ